jgi:hypothetical protein
MTLPDDWWLCRNPGCVARMEKFPGQRDETLVLQWLRGLRPDLSKMLEMRSLLAGEFGSTGLIRMSDHVVLTQIARLLIAGEIHIHRANDPPEQPQVRPEAGGAKPAKSDRLSRPPRKQFVPDAPFREPPADLPTFLSDIDLPVQAAALMAAASSGKPFCPE